MRRTPVRLVAAGLVGMLLLPSAVSAQSGGDGGERAATRSPIKHTIILYQENISFDHYFGTFGHGADGIPAGVQLSHIGTTGNTYGPYPPTALSGATQASTCDVDHGYADMIRMVDHGRMDGFLQFGNDLTVPQPSTPTSCPTFESNPGGPALALGYYEGHRDDPASPLQTYWDLARRYTLADHFFQGVYGPSTPGAEWLVAATNNTVHDPNPRGDVCNDYPPAIAPQDIPNLGVEATTAHVSWAWFQGGFGRCVPGSPSRTHGYSAHHDPFQYFTSTADLEHRWAWDPRMDYPEANRHQRDLEVLYDALAGTPINGRVVDLPAVSWLKAPTASDGHPGYSSPVRDDAFLADLVNRLQGSDYWKDTALIVAFDETGGWWDHVAPPDLGGQFATWVGDQPNLTGCQYPGDGLPCGEAGLGPRMPVLVISPYARRAFLDHDLMDTASLVNWVEWNHRLPALGVWGDRDRRAVSLRGAFQFGDAGARDERQDQPMGETAP